MMKKLKQQFTPDSGAEIAEVELGDQSQRKSRRLK
jgi:hypothetical protein